MCTVGATEIVVHVGKPRREHTDNYEDTTLRGMRMQALL